MPRRDNRTQVSAPSSISTGLSQASPLSKTDKRHEKRFRSWSLTVSRMYKIPRLVSLTRTTPDLKRWSDLHTSRWLQPTAWSRSHSSARRSKTARKIRLVSAVFSLSVASPRLSEGKEHQPRHLLRVIPTVAGPAMSRSAGAVGEPRYSEASMPDRRRPKCRIGFRPMCVLCLVCKSSPEVRSCFNHGSKMQKTIGNLCSAT